MTLYGHFKTRAELIDAVLIRTIAEAEQSWKQTDTSGDPRAALTRLVGVSWRIVNQSRSILQAAQRELPAEHIRVGHDRILRRVQSLIERGQRSGAFRNDLTHTWLTTVAIGLMHAAADDSTAGQLNPDEGATIISSTLLAALTPPGGPSRNPS